MNKTTLKSLKESTPIYYKKSFDLLLRTLSTFKIKNSFKKSLARSGIISAD